MKNISPLGINIMKERVTLQKYNYFGEALRRNRKKRKWTQKYIADRLGIKQAQWSAYELGKNKGDLDLLIVIAIYAFEMHPLDFWKECLEILEHMQANDKK